MITALLTELRKHSVATAIAIIALFATIYGIPAIFKAAGAVHPVQTNIRFPDAPKWLIVTAIVALSPLIEELVFRKGLIAMLRALRMPFWPAALISTALWVASHLPVTAAAILVYSISGLILCALLYRTQRLWPCIAAHAAYNSVPAILIVMYH